MSAKRAHIDIHLPAVNHFPELKHHWDREHQQQHQPKSVRFSMLSKNNNNNSEPSGIANKTAGALGEEDDLEGSGHSLYVVDSRGCLLEHVRYQGKDYRGALRAAITTKWKP